MKLTLVHPCIGRTGREGGYMKTWQMEPLPIAVIAGLTPPDVEVSFFDDRMEPIDYDRPTDVVAISVETYTAKRSYQIASEYRRRGVRVVMGGFHATLCPQEVGRYADVVVTGEAEGLWPGVIDDLRSRTEKHFYHAQGRPSLSQVRPDRSILAGRRYLPVRLIEYGRGCCFACDFCSIQAAFARTQIRRPVSDVLEELRRVTRPGDLVFFVDDNLVSDHQAAKEFLVELAALKIRWVSQAAITVARDEELLRLMRASGCQCVLVGFESLDPVNLTAMNKAFNVVDGTYDAAMRSFRSHGIRVYGTFLFGYDNDTERSFEAALEFANRNALFIAAFNHVTPFPGTALYDRLEQEGRLLYHRWWLDDKYRYGMIPFVPDGLDPQELEMLCRSARRRFYGLKSIVSRGLSRTNRDTWFAFKAFAGANLMHRGDIDQRTHHPLGDETWEGTLLTVG